MNIVISKLSSLMFFKYQLLKFIVYDTVYSIWFHAYESLIEECRTKRSVHVMLSSVFLCILHLHVFDGIYYYIKKKLINSGLDDVIAYKSNTGTLSSLVLLKYILV